MKSININTLVTAKVAEKLSQGYIIHTQTMSGSQGEEARIDFEKDGHIYRLVVNTETCFDDDLSGVRMLHVYFGRASRVDSIGTKDDRVTTCLQGYNYAYQVKRVMDAIQCRGYFV